MAFTTHAQTLACRSHAKHGIPKTTCKAKLRARVKTPWGIQTHSIDLKEPEIPNPFDRPKKARSPKPIRSTQKSHRESDNFEKSKAPLLLQCNELLDGGDALAGTWDKMLATVSRATGGYTYKRRVIHLHLSVSRHPLTTSHIETCI